MHASEGSSVGWLLPLSIVAIAGIARCDDDPAFQKRFTIASEASTFWLELDAHAGRVIVGDQFAKCKDHSRECNGQVRIFRDAGTKLVEEARFYGGREDLGGAVAIHGDRAAALLGERVQIYERGTAGWRVATTISVAGCGNTSVGKIALDAETLVLHTYDAICLAERRSDWVMTRLTSTHFNAAEPVINGNTLAFTELQDNRITIYRRGATGWKEAATVSVERAYALALSENGILAVDEEGQILLFDVSDKPRQIAKLRSQSPPGPAFGSELEIDRNTLAVWNDDGVHVYRRSGETWHPAGILRSMLPDTTWFGARLVLDGDSLWIGDPDMGDDSSRFPMGGLVHGYGVEVNVNDRTCSPTIEPPSP